MSDVFKSDFPRISPKATINCGYGVEPFVFVLQWPNIGRQPAQCSVLVSFSQDSKSVALSFLSDNM